MWTTNCENCGREIIGLSDTCEHCGDITDAGIAKGRKSNFKLHADKSSFSGRDYKKMPKVGVIKRMGQRTVKAIKKKK